MNQPLAGPGLGLPLPQNLYPSELSLGQNAPYDFATNKVCLAPGENLPIPAGDYLIHMGGYLVFQYRDPITGIWSFGPGAAYNRGPQFVKSDGYNLRIANLTGCPVSGLITSAGSAYVQSSTTVSVTGGGGSTWQAIVGGALALAGTSITTAFAGAGYGVAPLALIPAPPNASNNVNGVGGVPAAGYAAISSGTVSGFTLLNQGAGYPVAPGNLSLLPTPTDPNLSTGITLATIPFSLAASGSIAAVLCTNNGAPLALPASITLAVGGVGVTATVTAVYMQTITAATVSGQGTGYGTAAGAIMTVGGVPSTGISNTPDNNYLAWFPRPANIGLTPANTSVSVGSPGVVYDGGLFLGTPSALWVAGVGAGAETTVTLGTVAFVMGSRPDICVMQPAP